MHLQGRPCSENPQARSLTIGGDQTPVAFEIFGKSSRMRVLHKQVLPCLFRQNASLLRLALEALVDMLDALSLTLHITSSATFASKVTSLRLRCRSTCLPLALTPAGIGGLDLLGKKAKIPLWLVHSIRKMLMALWYLYRIQ